MDDSTPHASLATTLQAHTPALPIEIVQLIFNFLMNESLDTDQDGYQRNISFNAFGGINRIHRAITRKNGHYFVNTITGLAKLWELLKGDRVRARGVTSLALVANDWVAAGILDAIIRISPNAFWIEVNITAQRPDSVRDCDQERRLMESIGELRRVVHFEIRVTEPICTLVLARWLSHWPNLEYFYVRETDTREQDYDEDWIFNDYSVLPDLLNQITLPSLECVGLPTRTHEQRQLLKRLLSFEKVDQLDVFAIDLDANQLEVVRDVAYRLVSLWLFGKLDEDVPELYDLLERCECLKLSPWPVPIITIPSPSQLPSLRCFSVANAQEKHIEPIMEFISERDEPLRQARIHCSVEFIPALQEVCDSVGTQFEHWDLGGGQRIISDEVDSDETDSDQSE